MPLPELKAKPLHEAVGDDTYKNILKREIRLTNTLLEQKIMLDHLCDQ